MPDVQCHLFLRVQRKGLSLSVLGSNSSTYQDKYLYLAVPAELLSISTVPQESHLGLTALMPEHTQRRHDLEHVPPSLVCSRRLLLQGGL